LTPSQAALLVLCLVAASGCSDPVRSGKIDALGGETAGVPPGPLHRPGQPCVLCHGGDGPGGAVFSFAGTVYQDPMNTKPLSDAIVRLIDSNGKKHDAATNCAGNFFVMRSDYAPSFPVWTKVIFGKQGADPVSVNMGSAIYREGSCAACHGDPASTEETGHVFWAPVPVNVTNAGCP
jgi:hypothetical protein